MLLTWQFAWNSKFENPHDMTRRLIFDMIATAITVEGYAARRSVPRDLNLHCLSLATDAARHTLCLLAVISAVLSLSYFVGDLTSPTVSTDLQLARSNVWHFWLLQLRRKPQQESSPATAVYRPEATGVPRVSTLLAVTTQALLGASIGVSYARRWCMTFIFSAGTTVQECV